MAGRGVVAGPRRVEDDVTARRRTKIRWLQIDDSRADLDRLEVRGRDRAEGIGRELRAFLRHMERAASRKGRQHRRCGTAGSGRRQTGHRRTRAWTCRKSSSVGARAEVEAMLGGHDHAGHFAETPLFTQSAFGLRPGSDQDMRLAPGACLGPFEIIAALGAGGMGEVYRAHDTRLSRQTREQSNRTRPKTGVDPCGSIDRPHHSTGKPQLLVKSSSPTAPSASELGCPAEVSAPTCRHRFEANTPGPPHIGGMLPRLSCQKARISMRLGLCAPSI